jgi:tetratricopeptide (TPR) repeat protein
LGYLLTNFPDRYGEAEMAYREAIARDPQYAWPWIGLGGLLQDYLHRYDDAETAYREAIRCNPKETEAWNDLGDLLQEHLQRYDEAEVAYREAIARDPRSVWPWNGLGSLFCDFLDNHSDAAEAYDNALRLEPSNEAVHQNRLFLRRDFMGEGTVARPLMDELRALLTGEYPDTTRLHEALFAAYDSNWGLAREALAEALTLRADGFSPDSTEDWLRSSAVFLHLDYGAKLLAFLDERGDTARLRPWVEAVRAHHRGDRRALQNVAPEIRGTAEVFYDGIQARLEKLPEKTRRRPLPASKKTRARRTSSNARPS